MSFSTRMALCAGVSVLAFASATAAAPLKVAFVTAEGGLGDHSFNDMIDEGLKKAKADLGIEFVVIQPRAVSDFQSSLVRAAGQHFDLVLGATFDMIAPMKAAAAAFPDQKFGIIDVGSDPIAPNVEGAVAKDWEGSALVGVAAALTSRSGTIGFVGGKDIPVIHRFFNGYYYGAKLSKPDIKVLERYRRLLHRPGRRQGIHARAGPRRLGYVDFASGQRDRRRRDRRREGDQDLRHRSRFRSELHGARHRADVDDEAGRRSRL